MVDQLHKKNKLVKPKVEVVSFCNSFPKKLLVISYILIINNNLANADIIASNCIK